MKYAVYVGNSKQGIMQTVLTDDPVTLSPFRRLEGADNYGFLAPSTSGDRLYAAGETPESGLYATFAVDRATGETTLLDEIAFPAISPFACPDREDRMLFGAAYQKSALYLFSMDENRVVKECKSEIHLTGSGPNRERQEASHPHCCMVDSRNETMLLIDFGADKLLLYSLNAKERNIELLCETPAPAGMGPRHGVYHPNGEWAYVASELGNTVLGYVVEPQKPAVTLFQQLSTLPEGGSAVPTFAGDAKITPDGKLLFVSNRGHNSIAVFDVDERTGVLARLCIAPTHCAHRNMYITPDGGYLIGVGEPFGAPSGLEVLDIARLAQGKAATMAYEPFESAWGLAVIPLG